MVREVALYFVPKDAIASTELLKFQLGEKTENREVPKTGRQQDEVWARHNFSENQPLPAREWGGCYCGLQHLRFSKDNRVEMLMVK